MISSATYVNPLRAVAGGDVAFVLPSPRGHGIRIVNADVCNHGQVAFPRRARLELELRKLALEENAPSSILTRANKKLFQISGGTTSRFTTAIVMDLIPDLAEDSARLHMARAGHWPVIAALAGGQVVCLADSSEDRSKTGKGGCPVDVPLGVHSRTRYTDWSCLVNGLIAALAYSDGLVELPINGSRLLGLEGLKEAFGSAVHSARSNSAFDILNALRNVLNRRNPMPQDDISAVVVCPGRNSDHRDR